MRPFALASSAGLLVALTVAPGWAQDTAPADPPATDPAPAPAPAPALAPAPEAATATLDAPETSPVWEIAAHAGYSSTPIPGAITPLGGGLGGRFGFSVSNVYAGLASTYYFGGTDSGATESAILVGGEVGYGFHLSPELLLRPVVGVGGAFISHSEPLAATATTPNSRRPDVVSSASGSGGGAADSNTTRVTSFYVKPALSLLYTLGSDVFVGAGADVLYVPKVTYTDGSIASWVSYGLNAQVGKRF